MGFFDSQRATDLNKPGDVQFKITRSAQHSPFASGHLQLHGAAVTRGNRQRIGAGKINHLVIGSASTANLVDLNQQVFGRCGNTLHPDK